MIYRSEIMWMCPSFPGNVYSQAGRNPVNLLQECKQNAKHEAIGF